MSFGIALGGGGARGLAHVGILEVLEEHNIRPKCVAGTSIGSVVGALYCVQDSADGLRERAKQMVASEEFKNLELDRFYRDADNIFERFRNELFEKFFLGSLLFKKSHSNYDATKKIFRDVFGDMSFRDCVIPFTCNALDIQSGEEFVFENGPLADAVWASCAIPGIFPPFVKDKRIFVDGGVIDNIPVEPVLSIGAKSVLAVYLSKRPRYEGEPNTGFQINQRAYTFMKYHLDQRVLAEADMVIEPEVSGFHWADFSSIDTLIERGRTAALQNLSAIKSIDTRRHHLKKKLKQVFGVRSLL
jgi:NTE family protein